MTTTDISYPISVTKPHYFDNFITTNFTAQTYYEDYGDHVVVHFPGVLTDDQRASYQTLFNNYQEPPYYLWLNRTENQCLYTETINSPEPTIVQTFIVSPQASSNLTLGDMKTVIEIMMPDVSQLQYDSTNPVTVTVTLYDITRNVEINQTICDVSTIVQGWHSEQQSGASGRVSGWQSLQIYGLTDSLPDFDCIWQFKLSINDASINASLTSLQNLIYNKE